MQVLQVTLFSDGRPGHVKQSLGIVKALQAYIDVDFDRLEVPPRSLLDNLLSHISYLLKVDVGADIYVPEKSDIFIGTGSRTHVPMLAAGRKRGVKIVTCMSPASYLRAKFDLCCVPQHDEVKPADNIFFTVIPFNNFPDCIRGEL